MTNPMLAYGGVHMPLMHPMWQNPFGFDEGFQHSDWKTGHVRRSKSPGARSRNKKRTEHEKEEMLMNVTVASQEAFAYVDTLFAFEIQRHTDEQNEKVKRGIMDEAITNIVETLARLKMQLDTLRSTLEQE